MNSLLFLKKQWSWGEAIQFKKRGSLVYQMVFEHVIEHANRGDVVGRGEETLFHFYLVYKCYAYYSSNYKPIYFYVNQLFNAYTYFVLFWLTTPFMSWPVTSCGDVTFQMATSFPSRKEFICVAAWHTLELWRWWRTTHTV